MNKETSCNRVVMLNRRFRTNVCCKGMQSDVLSGQLGVTLVEMMIVVVIIGIGAVMAGPNLMQWLQQYELKQATTTLAARLQSARVHAISQSRSVIVNICLYPNAPCTTPPPPTGAGSVQAAFTFTGGAPALDSETFPPRVVSFNLPQAGPVMFNSRGLSTSAGPQTIQLLTQQFGYSVTVNPAGKISWCPRLVTACP